MIGKPKPPGWMFQKHVYFFLFCGFSTRNVFGQVSVQIFGFKCPIHRQTKGYHGNLVIITIINLFFWVFLFLTSNAFTTACPFIRHFEKVTAFHSNWRYLLLVYFYVPSQLGLQLIYTLLAHMGKPIMELCCICNYYHSISAILHFVSCCIL